ncbi:helix-turn-helix transcriptional regulator [Microbacterium sp. CBS5P-1]|nr:helix-turn-helix transcriptional regulator [Microbacterium excoecariae]
MGHVFPPPSAGEAARAARDIADRHALTLESLLAVLRSRTASDRGARQTAIDIAAAALVDLRAASDEREAGVLEPVAGAFARLTRDLRPLMTYGDLDVQFVEPPENGRALPGDVAHAARAIVRNAVLATVDASSARRIRIQWDCDGRNLLIGIRDDGAGDRAAHDDGLRPIAEHVAGLAGDMTVTATPGWGTDVRITIPLDPPPAIDGDALGALTPREREVAALLATGARNADIAREVGISEHTVKYHVSQILRRTGARTRAEVVGLLR